MQQAMTETRTERILQLVELDIAVVTRTLGEGKPAVALTSSVLAMALAIVLMPAAFSGYVALLNSLRASPAPSAAA